MSSEGKRKGAGTFSAALIFLCIMLISPFSPAYADQAKKNYKEGELLVKFKPNVSDAAKDRLHRKLNARKEKEFPGLRLHHAKLAEGMSVEDAVRLYTADPDVEYAEPNFEIRPRRVPNDARFADQWALHNAGQTGGTPDADMDAPEAWDITTGSASVAVAVIDTGVDYTHRDLSPNMWKNPGEIAGNGIDDDGNGYVDDVYGIDAAYHDSDPMDDDWHGTHVAGIIGAAGNNRTGVSGLNWNVKMIAVKFMTAGGVGFMDGAVECLEYVRNLKARGENIAATSNSWGYYEYSQALYDAIDAQRDILFITAAGNMTQDHDTDYYDYPTDYELPNVIAVAATDKFDALTYFSDWGRRSIHVGAPGLEILSTMPGNSYGLAAGTSMATPHVTGVAALIKAQDPSRDWVRIKNLLLSGGDSIASLNGITVTGKRVNAHGSLTCSNGPVFSILKYPSTISLGLPETISALSINCDAAAGPVVVTFSGGEVIELRDDGIAPDIAPADGLFAGTWVPSRVIEHLHFSSPAGSESLVINLPALTVTSTRLPVGAAGVPYATALTATGGRAPYTWSIVAGNLPPGLALDGATGVISGLAAAEGFFDFTVQVMDGDQAVVSRNVYIRINAFAWDALYGIEYDDYATAIAADTQGNVFVTGYFSNGYTADFRTIKYDPAGAILWVREYDSGKEDRAQGVAVDGAGNAYVAGYVYNGSNYDILIIKYDPSGNTVWSKTYGTSQDEQAYGITVDGSGNFYIAGQAYSSKTHFDFLTLKYTPAGKLSWAKTYSHSAAQLSDIARAVAVDGSGSVYVTGETNNGYDADYLTIKYNSSGTFQWARTHGTWGWMDDKATGVAVDPSGNAYVAGAAGGAYYTIKYSPAGDVLQSFSNYAGDAAGIALDGSGNIYVTGSGMSNYFGGSDYVTVKYDPAGNMVRTWTYDGGGSDYAAGVALGPDGHVHVTGYAAIKYYGISDMFNYLTVKY